MKLLRTALLVLLTLLLPVRGALAAAMPCSAGEHGMAVAEAQGHPPGHVHVDGADAASAEPAGPAPHAAESTAAHAGGCQLCASCCSVPPLLTEMPALHVPTVFARVSFPPLSTPLPSHRSDGPERPPRAC